MAGTVVSLPRIRGALAVMARLQAAGYFQDGGRPRGESPEDGSGSDVEAALDADDDGGEDGGFPPGPEPGPGSAFWSGEDDDEDWIAAAMAEADARAASARSVRLRELAGEQVIAIAAWRALRRA